VAFLLSSGSTSDDQKIEAEALREKRHQESIAGACSAA
jgi:hypothetical protein